VATQPAIVQNLSADPQGMCSWWCWDGAVDRKATTKSFNFATKRNLDFYYVSAADGTNVVKVCCAPDHMWSRSMQLYTTAWLMLFSQRSVQVFNEAIRKGVECKERPPDDFFVRLVCSCQWFGTRAKVALLLRVRRRMRSWSSFMR
jgi:hypothetical protein